MSDIFNNSIWPNGLQDAPEGHPVFYPLGTNKVEIPDGVTTMWPDGDKLIGDFVYKNGKVVGFIDTKALTVSDNTTIYLPYEHIEAEFSAIEKGQLQIHAPKATTKKASWKDSGVEDIPEVQFKYKGCKTVDNVKTVDANYKTTDIVNGVWSEPLWDLEEGGNGNSNGGMFYLCSNLTSFFSDLPSLTDNKRMFYKSSIESFSSDLRSLTNGYMMFKLCSNLTSFSSDLPKLTSGNSMFAQCSNLTSFNGDLSSLTTGTQMFSSCPNLTSFSSDLSSLTDGYYMFKGCNLTSFTFDLSNLTNGSYMFSSCPNLTSFSSNLSSMTNGERFFYNCSNLTSFNGDLSSLTTGFYMFSKCKLDAPSVRNIIDTINTYSAKLHLGMGCNDTTEDKDLFAQEVGYTDMTSLLAALQTKGWTVTAQYNGRPTTTYGLRRPSEDTLPVFVQLEETEDHADYTSMDETKKYILNYFHETTGSTGDFTQFNSLEEAIETLNIKPIERN